MSKYKHVFSPITIKGVEFKNRIEVAPMVPCMATPEGWVTKELIEFYRPFAKGGGSYCYCWRLCCKLGACNGS